MHTRHHKLRSVLPYGKPLLRACLMPLAACAAMWMAPACAQNAVAETAQMHLPRTQLRAGKARMDVQVASTAHQLQTGLMHRREMPADEGMLFVFPQAAMQCFWMKNTHLPLTAAFVAADGTIVNLADMQPFSEQNHCSARPVPYVLEMHQGWFKRKGIRPGMRISDAQGVLFKQQGK